MSRSISFTLPSITPLTNLIKNMHSAEYKKLRDTLCLDIRVAAGHLIPREPIEFAELSIIRSSTHMPDIDGLIGGLKPLIDCLICFHPRSAPSGLGFIRDDSCARLWIAPPIARKVSARSDVCTLINIRALDTSSDEFRNRLKLMNLSLDEAIQSGLKNTGTKSRAKAKSHPSSQAGITRISADEYRSLINRQPKQKKRPRHAPHHSRS